MDEINTRIISSLREIEGKKSVKILYACESGSRAWGFPSADSDYDVRFVYVQPIKRYLSLRKRRDVIEVTTVDGKLDISGWDLQKALLLLRKSNPPLLGWLGPINEFLEHELNRFEKYQIDHEKHFAPMEDLDGIFFSALEEVWGY